MRFDRAKTLTVLLAASFCLQTPGFCARFVDTSGKWTEKYINSLSDKGIILPASDGKFNPDKPVTRAELAEWLVKILGLENQPVPSSSSFPDVKPTDPFFRAVEIIRQNNYISGYADGFRPRQFIQRAEVITILSRTLNAPEPDLNRIAAEMAKYSDSDKVPGWAKTGIAEASIAGIIVNDENSKLLNPTSIATRGDTAALLSKLDEYKTQKDIDRLSASAPTATGTAFSGAPAAPQQPPFSAAVSREMYNPPAGTLPPPQYPAAPFSQPPQYAPPPTQQQYSSQTAYGQPPQFGPAGGYQQAPPGYLQGGITTVASGTNFQAKLMNTLDSASSQQGEPVQATLGQPIYSNGIEAVPAGSRLIGSVTSVLSAKRFKAGANGKIEIKFTELDTPDGRKFPLAATVDGGQIRLTGGTNAGRAGKALMTTGIGAGGGAVVGTALGAIVGGMSNSQNMGKSVAMGAIFGTAIGAGGGAVAGVVRKGSEVKFPAGMSLPIKLDAALQITPQPPQPYYGTGATN
ncbi:MAG TPA: S-layer homology domain-containing protein [Candidatus Obscuribacterales bacterium]